MKKLFLLFPHRIFQRNCVFIFSSFPHFHLQLSFRPDVALIILCSHPVLLPSSFLPFPQFHLQSSFFLFFILFREVIIPLLRSYYLLSFFLPVSSFSVPPFPSFLSTVIILPLLHSFYPFPHFYLQLSSSSPPSFFYAVIFPFPFPHFYQ